MSVNNSLELNSSSVYLTDREVTKRTSLDDFGSKLAEADGAAAVDSNRSTGNTVVSENIVKKDFDNSPKNDGSENSQQESALALSTIDDKLKIVNEQLSFKSTSLVFEFDDANDPPIVKVIDKESGDVIREIPPKDLREIAKALTEIADNINENDLKKPNKLSSGIFIDERF